MAEHATNATPSVVLTTTVGTTSMMATVYKSTTLITNSYKY